MSGFWAGSVPAWAYVVGVLLCNAALLVGMWVGWGRGFEAAREDLHFEREQVRARRVYPVYRERQEAIDRHSAYARAAFAGAIDPPEVAHEAWLAHTEQAMHLANELPENELTHEWHDHPPLKWDDEGVPGCPSCEARWECPPPESDPRTDSQWTADHIADLDAFMAALLGQHPATEDL